MDSNGNHEIQRVAADQLSFDIPVVFNSGTAATLKLVEHTVAGCKFALGETVSVSNTSNNVSQNTVRITDDSFFFPQTFAAGDLVGTATSIGLDETSEFVTTSLTGAQKESKSIGSVVVVDNTLVTVITVQDQWEPLELNSLAMAGSNAELWGIVDSTTGGIAYLGSPAFSGEMIAGLSCTSSGGNQRFQFRVVVDGVPLADGATPAFGLSSSPMLTISVTAPVQCVTGEEVSIEVRNRDGLANILVEQLSSAVS